MEMQGNKRKLIAVIAAGALVLAAVLTLMLLRLSDVQPAGDYAAVYAKGSQNLCLALPEGIFSLQAGQSRHQVFGGERDYLYYDAVTDDGLDFYACALRDSRSRKAGGALVQKGIGCPGPRKSLYEGLYRSCAGDCAKHCATKAVTVKGRLFVVITCKFRG